jgi:type IV secretion system protein VirB10
MPGADADGEAGFNDKVDTHMARFWTNAVLLSAITAGITWSQNQWGGYSSFGQPISAGQVLSQATGQILGMSIAKLLEKNLDVSPTIKIRPGYRFNIMVVKDLLFEKPYRVPIYSRN